MAVVQSTITCRTDSCGCQSGKGLFQVRWAGAQRMVLGGDIRGHVPLAPLAGQSHLYGLGPLEELKGEITILHSEPSISRVQEDKRVSVEAGFNHRACFLVYSQVASWRGVPLPDEVRDLATLEAVLPELAARNGIDPKLPFPFLLRGRPARIDFHILNKTDGLPHTPELHEKAKVHFAVEHTGVEIIGFHSHEHRGIFTPRDSNLHLHVRTDDGSISGHVEEITVPGLQLLLPAVVEWRTTVPCS